MGGQPLYVNSTEHAVRSGRVSCYSGCILWTFPITGITSIRLIAAFISRLFDSTFPRLRFFLFRTFGFWTFLRWSFFGRRMRSRPRPRSRSWFSRGRIRWRWNSALIGWSFWVSFWCFMILNDFFWHGLKNKYNKIYLFSNKIFWKYFISNYNIFKAEIKFYFITLLF